MSIRIMNRVWDTNVGSGTGKLVLIALADNANDQGTCYPAMDTIAKKCDLTVQGVRNQIKKLESAGLVQVELRKGRNSANLYTVLPETPNGVGGVKIQGPPTALAQTPNGVSLTPNAVGVNHQEPSPNQTSTPDGVPPLESGKEAGESEHAKFFRLWTVAYAKKFGRGYKVLGGRDGKAIKNMLAEPGATAEMLMAVVNQAWAADPKKCFQCSKLVNAWQIESNWNFLNAELASSGVSALRPAGIPTLGEVNALCKEKWGKDARHTNWGASFFRFWDGKEWKRHGIVIDWRVELSNQVNKWRKAESE